MKRSLTDLREKARAKSMWRLKSGPSKLDPYKDKDAGQ
jgi:hypothetical protein